MRVRGLLVTVVVVVACNHAASRLSSTEQLAVAILIGNPDFGAVTINTSSDPRAFQIGPEGDALQENRVFGITTCPNFPLVSIGETAASGTGSATGLDITIFRRCAAFGGGTYGGEIYGDTVTCSLFEVSTLDFAVKFSPTQTGDQSCAITIHADTGDRTYQVTGNGKLPDHAVVFEPRLTAMPFPEVRAGDTSDPFEVKVINAGGMALSVQATKVGDSEFELAAGTPGSQSLAPGATETFQVVCKPVALGPLAGDFLITTNSDNADDTSLPIPMSCEGIPSDSIKFTPSPPLPMVTRVGDSVEQEFTLRNDAGSVPANVVSVGLRTSHPELDLTQPAVTSIPVLAQTTFKVIYSPTVPFEGTLDFVEVNIQNEVLRTTPIQVSATLATPRAEPASIDFGPICVAQSKPGPLAIYAEDDGSFVVTGFTLSGPQGVPFTVASPLGSVTPMPIRNDVPFMITAAPTTPGDYDQTLVVTTDAPTEPSTVEIPLKAIGLDPGITASPTLLPFSSTVVTGYTNPKTGFFTNCTDAPLPIADVRLEGDAADFTITDIRPSKPPFDLLPAGRLEIDVQLYPQSAGGKTAQLVIDFGPDDQRTIDLTGEAFLGTPDRDSYYRCSTGSATPAWPVLAVVWLVVRRRRRR
jgi:uncharacterized protein (TIGR03382 family)